MADTQWKVGDIVSLKSGGPEMTVTFIQTYEGVTTVHCDWFDGTQKLTGIFPPDALQR